jgi:IS5 family transposase
MKLFNELVLKFEKPNWAASPEFGLIDTILESNPHLIKLLKNDIIGKEKENNFGRKDTPSVEQIGRAAIYKEMKGLDYRELEFAQVDSRICATFIKLDMREPFSFQMFQKYISRIKASTLQKALVEINKIAIKEGFEDILKIRQDTTVVETNIHYPTNNSLVWDCIKESHRLLSSLKEEITTLNYRDYLKSAKRTYFKINVTKNPDKKKKLFEKQLITFTKVLNQTSNAIKKKSGSLTAMVIQTAMERLLILMEKVYEMTIVKEVMGKTVANEDKIFSIYELHTDIIVKGSREVQFGHKVNLATGKSNLIIDCDILKGNPSDKDLFQPTINRVIENYGIIPRDSSNDGGFASIKNTEFCIDKGIVNVVFNKVVGSMQNVASSLRLETMLKKWRSGIEAVISNLKRGFNLRVCNWKGWEHFKAKVMWSVLGYNFRVMSVLVLNKIKHINNQQDTISIR